MGMTTVLLGDYFLEILTVGKIMKKRHSLFLIVLVLLLDPRVHGQSSEPAIYNDTDAYDVYSAVLSLPENSTRPKQKIYVIRQDTLRVFGAYTDSEPSSGICLRPDDEFKPIVGPAIEDYLRENKTKWRLGKKFDLDVPYELVSSETVIELIKKNGWEGFYKVYPDSRGFTDLSAVGFNTDKTVAVVSKGGWCGELCGEGRYYVMQKKQGKWIPLDWRGDWCSWVS